MTTANRAERRATRAKPKPIQMRVQPVVRAQLSAFEAAELRSRQDLIARREAHAQQLATEAQEEATVVALLKGELGDYLRATCTAKGLPADGQYTADAAGNLWGEPVDEEAAAE